MVKLQAVSLTSSESQLFQLLLRVVSQRTSHTTMRVAGGWVRDKLLGLPSSDIDVAVDTMTGEEFATLIKEELNKESKVISTFSRLITTQINPCCDIPSFSSSDAVFPIYFALLICIDFDGCNVWHDFHF